MPRELAEGGPAQLAHGLLRRAGEPGRRLQPAQGEAVGHAHAERVLGGAGQGGPHAASTGGPGRRRAGGTAGRDLAGGLLPGAGDGVSSGHGPNARPTGAMYPRGPWLRRGPGTGGGPFRRPGGSGPGRWQSRRRLLGCTGRGRRCRPAGSSIGGEESCSSTIVGRSATGRWSRPWRPAAP